MKKVILFSLILFLLLPVFADDAKLTYIDEKEGWKTTDTESPANQYAFNAVFNGVEYNEIGFSQTMTSYSKGMGLTKNEYTNKSLTMTQIAHDSSSYTYSTKDTDGNNISGGYIYWYMSVCQAMTLYLKVESSIPATNSITVDFDTYTYSWVTTTGGYQYVYVGSGKGNYAYYEGYGYYESSYGSYSKEYVEGTTSLSSTKSDDKTEITSPTTATSTTDYGTVVVSVPACYAVVQGNSEFSVEATVKQYPESRRIGTLKLTLVTT
jgi:hypothetical protein